jgi:hypothetical protein
MNMVTDFVPYQLLRIAATPTILLAVLAPSDRMVFLLLALVLVLLDALDCRFGDVFNRLRGRPGLIPCSSSAWYRVVDKLTDQMQYAAALCLLWPVRSVPTDLKRALLAAWAWRMAGVAAYVFQSDPVLLVVFPDFFKEFLVLWALPTTSSPLPLVPLVVAGKAAFEWLKGIAWT